MLRATNHAGVTVCNRDRESGLPKCLPLPGDPWSNFHRLILLCHSNPAWIPVSPLELLSHPSARCEDDRFFWSVSLSIETPLRTPPRDKPWARPTRTRVRKTIGTKSIPRCWHRSLYFRLLVFVSSESAALVPAFGLRKDSPHVVSMHRHPSG